MRTRNKTFGFLDNDVEVSRIEELTTSHSLTAWRELVTNALDTLSHLGDAGSGNCDEPWVLGDRYHISKLDLFEC